MTAGPAIARLSPSQLADAVVEESLTGFLALWGGTLLLLVRIEDGDADLARGLGAAAVRGGAWFELDEAGDLQVSDGGSKNRTCVNGEKLPPRQPRRIASGDVVRFGSVECVLCSPEALWSAIRLMNGAPR